METTSWDPGYMRVKTALTNLTPVNDSCVRALALAITFNNSITNEEKSYQDPVLIKKTDLKKML